MRDPAWRCDQARHATRSVHPGATPVDTFYDHPAACPCVQDGLAAGISLLETILTTLPACQHLLTRLPPPETADQAAARVELAATLGALLQSGADYAAAGRGILELLAEPISLRPVTPDGPDLIEQ